MKFTLVKYRVSSIGAFFKSKAGVPLDIYKGFLELIDSIFIDDSKSTTISRFKRFWEEFPRKPNRSLKLTLLQSYLITYLQTLIHAINNTLKTVKNIDLDRVSYVLCMEKCLMSAFYIPSRNELLDIIKENSIVDFTRNSRKMIIVDQGERIAWRMVENSKPKPLSYYVHAHVSDSHIYLKLKEVVDTTGSNGGIPDSSSIHIQDKLITMESVYNQVIDVMWSHIQEIDELESRQFLPNHNNSVELYSAFKVRLKQFIMEEVNL